MLTKIDSKLTGDGVTKITEGTDKYTITTWGIYKTIIILIKIIDHTIGNMTYAFVSAEGDVISIVPPG